MKTEIELKKERDEAIRKYIADQYNELFFTYDQIIESSKFDMIVDLTIKNLYHFGTKIFRDRLDGAFAELISGKQYYRNISVASYISAYTKVNQATITIRKFEVDKDKDF